MSDPDVAIVGSGPAAAAVAHHLIQHGIRVEVFEKGPEIPYPYTPIFEERFVHRHRVSHYEAAPDLTGLTSSGEYRFNPRSERVLVVGGSGTHWGAVTLRMRPQDFRTRTLFGFGEDWPVTYEALEPYYCRAEAFFGVSGTDTDNPFAPRRSRPYPLPPFELAYEDRLLAARLRERGIVVHTTPQARTRLPYETRPACVNYGTCSVCPIGARYSPNYHLAQAVASGRCRVTADCSVRRIVLDGAGRARAVVCRRHNESRDREVAARVIVLAAGALESPRLLLLSRAGAHPSGLGNAGGHVGAHLTFHHLWRVQLRYREALHPGRVGAFTAQSLQFLDPPRRGAHGGAKVEMTASHLYPDSVSDARTGEEMVEAMRPMAHERPLVIHGESAPSPDKRLTLGTTRDRFGDPEPHLAYRSSSFDHATHAYGRTLVTRFAEATGADPSPFPDVPHFFSGGHHMGTCRMGASARDSVVDSFGRLHGVPNLFVVGSSTFCTTSGAVNPTLTLVALALRSADQMLESLRS